MPAPAPPRAPRPDRPARPAMAAGYWRAAGVVGVLVLLGWALLAGTSTPTVTVGQESRPPAVVVDPAAVTDATGSADPTATPDPSVASLPIVAAAVPDPTIPPGPVPVTGAAPDERAKRAIAYALAQRGIPYVWGGDGPDAGEPGFDCSGLTKASYGSAGVALPRTAQTQYDAGPHVLDANAPAPGDLIFYGVPTAVHHVGLYLGNGLMVQAPHTGTVVQVSPYRWSGDDYLGATRPAAPTDAVSPGDLGGTVVPHATPPTDLAPEGPAVTPLEPRIVVVPAAPAAPAAITPAAPSAVVPAPVPVVVDPAPTTSATPTTSTTTTTRTSPTPPSSTPATPTRTTPTPTTPTPSTPVPASTPRRAAVVVVPAVPPAPTTAPAAASSSATAASSSGTVVLRRTTSGLCVVGTTPVVVGGRAVAPCPTG